ncbi:MAG: VWA domain-containing protein [Deltaproteobacteria bacterium]|jgi:hypothetical protein|nr:VWA domain-containing protein [Deltaproteobacteria bacterium]
MKNKYKKNFLSYIKDEFLYVFISNFNNNSFILKNIDLAKPFIDYISNNNSNNKLILKESMVKYIVICVNNSFKYDSINLLTTIDNNLIISDDIICLINSSAKILFESITKHSDCEKVATVLAAVVEELIDSVLDKIDAEIPLPVEEISLRAQKESEGYEEDLFHDSSAEAEDSALSDLEEEEGSSEGASGDPGQGGAAELSEGSGSTGQGPGEGAAEEDMGGSGQGGAAELSEGPGSAGQGAGEGATEEDVGGSGQGGAAELSVGSGSGSSAEAEDSNATGQGEGAAEGAGGSGQEEGEAAAELTEGGSSAEAGDSDHGAQKDQASLAKSPKDSPGDKFPKRKDSCSQDSGEPSNSTAGQPEPVEEGQGTERNLTSGETGGKGAGPDKRQGPVSLSHRDDQRQTLMVSQVLRAKLQGLIQADRLVRNWPARHGRLRNNRLARLYLGDAKIFDKLAEKKLNDTNIHILLDSSSSMAGPPIKLAQQACLTIALALYPLPGLNLAISYFAKEGSKKCTEIVLDYGKRPRIDSQISASGGTPLYQATVELVELLKHKNEKRKILFIITDGYPYYWENDILNEFKNLNIEIYGIGIMKKEIKNLLPNTSIIIDKIIDLPNALFELMKKILLNQS